MTRLTRLLRHRLWDQGDARRALPADALRRLADKVTASEAHHSGEIRICVEAGLPLSYLWRGASARERAVAMFGKLRVWDTEHNNGVLIYLLLAEHAIEIVADRGLNHRISAAQWQAVLQPLRQALAQGQFEQGLSEAVQAVHGLLLAHFPRPPGLPAPNELPDAVVLI